MMDDFDESVDDARRRLAGLLLGTPLAGVLGAAASLIGTAAAGAPANGEVPPQPAAAGAGPSSAGWVHAYAAYGEPKYGADYTHFEYVSPNAPKGGTLKLKNPDRRTSFDKYNPWTTRGNAPAGVLIWMVEGLAHLSQDEPQTMYGLLADSILVAPDFSAVSFRLRPEARFSNGDAVTAEDVKFSFTILAGKGAGPNVQTQLAGIERVTVVDARTVRFDMRDKSREQAFVAGTMPVLSRKWGAGKSLDEIITDYPITSGPYVIDKVDMPRRIEFKLNPAYWGKHLPVRRGHFNFERVIYRMYSDNRIALEAFKAGEFDLLKEYASRVWVRQHAGVKWEDGRIIKVDMPTAFGYYMQSFIINMRRPVFKDIRVREALLYTYDFETYNRTRVFKRVNSEFNNSAFAAQGLPGPGELALLEPFRAELPPRVFGPAFVAPRTDADPNALRRNLLKARELLAQAGWKLDDGGVLRNAQGQPFEIEYMVAQTREINDWQRNMLKLGIKLTPRLVDYALFTRRLKQYDFDLVTIAEGAFTLPQASEMSARFGSKSADEEGNENYRGAKSRAADAAIDAMNRAATLQQLQDAARALDRIVTWSIWQIPDLYLGVENVSHWDRFGKPAVMAKYFRADTIIGGFIEHGPWPLWTWWDKSLATNPTVKPG